MVTNKKIDCKFCETTSSKINILKKLIKLNFNYQFLLSQ